jgi:hypothetical protein
MLRAGADPLPALRSAVAAAGLLRAGADPLPALGAAVVTAGAPGDDSIRARRIA